MSDNVPFNIQAEIIKSLPVKSLIRFRLVSNQWNSFIGSSKFIAEYHTHQKRRHHLLVRLLSSHNLDDFDEKYVSIVDDDTFPQHKFSLNVPPSFELLDWRHIISSQGLLFVHRYDPVCSGTLKGLIWNPIIRKSVDIEVSIEPRPDSLTLGFGVCPDTCDPKIVKFTYYQYWGTIFEVFTLSTNAWRRLTKNLPGECIEFEFTDYGVAIDRFMYWFAFEARYLGDRPTYKRNLIVSFDMTSEEFTEINLPDSLEVDPSNNFKLYNIRESLVVVYFKEEAGKRVHSVWKMMEHGVSKSFTKLYTINTTDVISRVYGFRKSGEPLIVMKNDHQMGLFAYDPDSKHINYIGISGRYFFPVISYIETLLLLDH